MTMTSLTDQQRARIQRFVELNKKRGVEARLNDAQTKVELLNKQGKVIASRPVSDFAD
jgi:hypothetical protein